MTEIEKNCIRSELRTILNRVEPQRVWRAVRDETGEVLHRGHADCRDGDPEYIEKADFEGKTVLDIGCNFGFYSFLVQKLGAAEVTGVDTDEEAIRACRLLARLYGLDGLRFFQGKFTTAPLPGPFDTVLLINLMGKNKARRGVRKILDAVARLAGREIVLTAACAYDIDRFLDGDYESFRRNYPPEYIRGTEFHFIDFIKDYLGSGWDAVLLSPAFAERNVKRTLLFRRKTGKTAP